MSGRADSSTGDVDVAIVPALGVTQNGYRLGMGRGFTIQHCPTYAPRKEHRHWL